MVLGKLPVPGRPTVWIIVGQGPIALAVGAGGGCLDIFTLIYPFSPLSPSLWETARYRLKYCLKGPLNLKQPTNDSILIICVLKRTKLFKRAMLCLIRGEALKGGRGGNISSSLMAFFNIHVIDIFTTY